MEKKELYELAWEALENAYAIYSHYRVGACVLCRDGSYFIGANIENASYGLTNCAERSALFATYSHGYRKDDIIALAVVCEGPNIATPCGACRQVLSELIGKDVPIYLANREAERETTISELLPYAFSGDELDV